MEILTTRISQCMQNSLQEHYIDICMWAFFQLVNTLYLRPFAIKSICVQPPVAASNSQTLHMLSDFVSYLAIPVHSHVRTVTDY